MLSTGGPMKQCIFVLCIAFVSVFAHAQQLPPTVNQDSPLRDWNQQIAGASKTQANQSEGPSREYRIGPEDLLEISVFGVPEMNSTVRVSASGEISLALVGTINTTALTPRGLEMLLEEKLRQSYINDPHVSIFIKEMRSRPVSVFGAVNRAGVFQISGQKSLMEILSLAEGLSQDAGDTVIVMRGGSTSEVVQGQGSEWAEAGAAQPGTPNASETVKINLKDLLESGDPRYNIAVYPQDSVTVTRAGIVYVVGEVQRAGGFVLKNNENISVLQAVALAEGLTPTAKKGNARIIRTEKETGKRDEIPVDLDKILQGKATDMILQPNDVLFVPNSTAKNVMYKGATAALSTLSGLIIWRR